MKTNLIAGIIIAIVAVLIVAFLLLSQPANVPKKIELEPLNSVTTELCPSGLPKSDYLFAEPLVKQRVLLWFENASKQTKIRIAEEETNISLEPEYTLNASSRKSIKTVVYILKSLDYHINYFYDLTKNAKIDLCSTISNGSLSNILGSYDLVISDAVAMLNLFEEITNESSCWYTEQLDNCLSSRWSNASDILTEISQYDFKNQISDDCFSIVSLQTAPPALRDSTSLNAFNDYLSNLDERTQATLNVEVKQAILNAHKNAWNALKEQFEIASEFGTDEDALIQKIVISEEIINFNIYFQGLKSIGCA